MSRVVDGLVAGDAVASAAATVAASLPGTTVRASVRGAVLSFPMVGPDGDGLTATLVGPDGEGRFRLEDDGRLVARRIARGEATPRQMTEVAARCGAGIDQETMVVSLDGLAAPTLACSGVVLATTMQELRNDEGARPR